MWRSGLCRPSACGRAGGEDARCYEPVVGPGAEPLGGVPVWDPVPLPMLGQLRVDPVPELDPEDEPDPEDELDEPELEVPEELPVPLLVDGVVVEELEVEPEPELPVVVEVVAALATSAPPARRPEVERADGQHVAKADLHG